MRKLFPALDPYDREHLAVTDRHTLYLEQCGRPDGLPVLFLHGGPGAGIAPYHRRFFDPARYRIVLFDQRGAGQSTPFADLTDNTTWDLVADIETIRKHLGIDRWVVFGGSWGSTLALAYAETHPDHCLALVLRGIFLGRPEEVRWFYEAGGAANMRPEAWRRYVEFIPEDERGHLREAYWQRLTGASEQIRLAAAREWGRWEGGALTLEPSPATTDEFTDPTVALSLARVEAHYFRHDCFFEPNQLLRDIHRIRHLPGIIVQGRYDLVCAPKSAYDLAQAWPEAELHMVISGHAASEPAVVDALIAATDAFATRFG